MVSRGVNSSNTEPPLLLLLRRQPGKKQWGGNRKQPAGWCHSGRRRKHPHPSHQASYVDKSMVAFAQSLAAFAQTLTDQSCRLPKRFNTPRQTAQWLLERTRTTKRNIYKQDNSCTHLANDASAVSNTKVEQLWSWFLRFFLSPIFFVFKEESNSPETLSHSPWTA